MNAIEMTDKMRAIFDECQRFRAAGQAEYARDADAFANFKRVGERLGLSPEKVLMVYLEKHLDGIHAFIGGHRSQREPIQGRINDAIVYLCLLEAMIEEHALPTALPIVTTR